ncbi:MAG: efflux transporter outer membrane subunit [Burkholderiales bacterium]|nr:efflux transporter outer membrane subunit [Burkholderiales bacterium]MDE1926626.1 efflux transporter outer membrane subunit [Burkholderiales bacterium]MDE2158804.1 efflux transporter outer membrane subunit [Burkholderiales bacterium]MDE2503987.1 efflux transporter outer membrane subunit [Burkholderiales bacterium]
MNASLLPGRRPAVAAAIGLALAGCASGPDFKPPAPPATAAAAHPYTAAALPARTASAPVAGGAAQRWNPAQDVPALWWQLYRSPALDQLIRGAIERSPSLAAAQAALRQAQALYEADAGNKRWPGVTGSLGAQRARSSQIASGTRNGVTYNLFNASVNVAYTVDAFGATKRELEGLGAQIDYQHDQLEAAYLTLTANLVTTAIQEASLRAQLAAVEAVVAAESSSLQLVQMQSGIGAVPRSAVLSQQAQLAQTRASLPALEKALAQTRQTLAVLAGLPPGTAGLPEFDLATLELPQELPLSLPSALVRQRPDIRASEALLHQASAQLGVATANQYPQITLSASLGSQAAKLSQMFTSPATAWTLGAGLVAPIFNGGALQAKRRAAVAALDQAQAQYRQVVLGAFLDVANTLQALDADARGLRAQAEAAELARQSLQLVSEQYGAGAVSYLALLEAQRAYQQTQVALVQAQAARYADTAALFQALGGGWWRRDGAAVAASN